MLDIEKFLSDHSTRGLHVMDGDKILRNYCPDDFDFAKDEYFPAGYSLEDRIMHFAPKYQKNLRAIAHDLSTILFEGVEHELGFYDSTTYIERETCLWHSDYPDLSVFPGYKLTFNCYFTSSDESTGGWLEFTHETNVSGQDVIDPTQVYGAYPKKNQIIIFNHIDFIHRATKTNAWRPFLSFMLKFPLISGI